MRKLLLILVAASALAGSVGDTLVLAQPAPSTIGSPTTAPDTGHTSTKAATVKKKTSSDHERVPWILEVFPFVLLLLSIALVPVFGEHWWEKNSHKALVAAICGAPILLNLLIFNRDIHALIHAGKEYVAFIVLLWSLFTISGGIVLRGNLLATPLTNTTFLAIGAVIANIFGTTGAAMLLIRVVLKTNREREYKKHTIIFFIFLVANIGGCLTPLGDPPLFLGFLRGVPFEWTLQLWPMWLTKTAMVLAVYFIWDTMAYRREDKSHRAWDAREQEPLRLHGAINFVFIAGVILSILFGVKLKSLLTGTVAKDYFPFGEGLMILMGVLSMVFTSKRLREENDFSFHAIIEVAILFAGIFVTMIPALTLLRLKGGSLGFSQPWQFFWGTGTLSAFLDNAPTYLTFVSLAQGVHGTGEDIVMLATKFSLSLKAISVGAVFMGAYTYIGNAPNFMVKAIAETAPPDTRVKMPSFFGYLMYSLLILFPLDILITLLFFR